MPEKGTPTPERKHSQEVTDKTEVLKALYLNLDMLEKSFGKKRSDKEVQIISDLQAEITLIEGRLKAIASDSEYLSAQGSIKKYLKHFEPDADRLAIDGEELIQGEDSNE